jgi:hypothetical protein
MKPLEDNLAFELIDRKETWHPCWKGNINDKVNVQSIKVVINCVQQNKEVSLILLDDCVLVLILIFDAVTSRQEQQGGDQRP